jgi:F-type H+-transporting ATPase subunit epsilon
MAKIYLDIVTPERTVTSEETDEVIAPGFGGLFGVRPSHAPFLTAIEPGELSFKTGSQQHRFAIGGGFVEVAEDKVTVLADSAEAAEEIDIERAKRAGEDAVKRLATLRETDPEFRIEAARVKRSAARIKIAGRR